MATYSCLPTSGTVYNLNSKACISKSFNSGSSRILHRPYRVAFPRIKSSKKPCELCNCSSSRGMKPQELSAASSPPLFGDHSDMLYMTPKLTRRLQAFKPLRAWNEVRFSSPFPRMTEKPKWWWRTLACLQYLLPLHEIIMLSKISYPPHPFLKHGESFAFPFWLAVGRIPSWLMMAYGTALYLGVIRRNECPHFFRFHAVMGLLLEYALQILVTVSGWLPNTLYCNTVGMQFWFAVAIVYLLMVLECMRSALAGNYADVPFFSEAACIQAPK